MRQSKGITDDVRMRGFSDRHTVEAALAWLDGELRPLDAESVPLQRAAGRVLASHIVGELDVPGFDRSMMDGYALAATTTDGASVQNPVPITVIGDALPARPFEGPVTRGQAVRIMTGAPLPIGCDAVLPAESVDSTTARATEDHSREQASHPRSSERCTQWLR